MCVCMCVCACVCVSMSGRGGGHQSKACMGLRAGWLDGGVYFDELMS